MDSERFCSIKLNENFNSELVNTINGKQTKVKELNEKILTAWQQNKESEIEINQLYSTENEQQNIIQKNIEIISALHIQIQIAEEKYRSYVAEKENRMYSKTL